MFLYQCLNLRVPTRYMWYTVGDCRIIPFSVPLPVVELMLRIFKNIYNIFRSKKAKSANEVPFKHKLSFKEFEHHTEDAWDASDDDLLREGIGKIKIHPEHVMVRRYLYGVYVKVFATCHPI